MSFENAGQLITTCFIVIITKSNSGWVVETDQKEIETFFHFLDDIQKSDLLSKGKNAKNFLKDNLTWDKIAKLDYLEK